MSEVMDYGPVLERIVELLEALVTMVEQHGNNIAAGLQIIIYCVVAFLLWQVIRIVYGLLGRVFLGGV